MPKTQSRPLPSNIIQAEFDSYLKDVIPVDAPTVQIVESKRAFFAGAQSMMHQMLLISEDVVTEDQGVNRLEAIRLELEQFKKDVVGGRA